MEEFVQNVTEYDTNQIKMYKLLIAAASEWRSGSVVGP